MSRPNETHLLSVEYEDRYIDTINSVGKKKNADHPAEKATKMRLLRF